ncbi:unnamed protein product [Parnassius apollo]|uniref:(apollo) hypothetical protein n=1 Tax=Parnassius apollo TaxID=110799 RepID=A0A8S3XPH8_PARAO|nr:unnamed protein product [Parnassius apollo]
MYMLTEIKEKAEKEQRRILAEIDDVSDHLEDDKNFPLDDCDSLNAFSESVVLTNKKRLMFISPGPTTSTSSSVPSIKSSKPTR